MDREQTTRFVLDLLRLLIDRQGSELFLAAGFPPAIRVAGRLVKVSAQALTAQHTAELARALMGEVQAAQLAQRKECSFSRPFDGLGRFRVHVFMQRGQATLVLRSIRSGFPGVDELALPAVCKEVALSRRGLVVVAGAEDVVQAAFAALVDHRNEHAQGHILCFDDTIVHEHAHKNCVVTQREVGVDTDGTDAAFESARHHGADMVVLGRVRDRAGIARALSLAEQDCLCLVGLQAAGVQQALRRLVLLEPAEGQGALSMALALDLRAVLALRWVPRQDGRGRVLAAAVLLDTPTVSEALSKGEFAALGDLMQGGREVGMQTFDQSLYTLYDAGLIGYEDALRCADAVNGLRLQIKLKSARARSRDLFAGTEHLLLAGGSTAPAPAPAPAEVDPFAEFDAAAPLQPVPGPVPAPAAVDPFAGLGGAAPLQPGSTPAAPAPSPVLLGASAPQALCPGAEFTARFVAYAADFEPVVQDLLAKLSPRSTSHLALKTCRWQPGARLTVRLQAAGLTVDSPSQDLEWPGDYLIAEFDVQVPASMPPATVVLKFDVLIESFVVARLRLDLQVQAGTPAPGTAHGRGEAARTAFASYASADRDRVLDRVASARISAGLDIFLDCLSLYPNESWKPRLEREIAERDLFLLFWSRQAASSEWVAWEWKTACERKGRGALQLHPLDSDAAPPAELSDLHFGDPLMQMRSPPAAAP